MFMYNGYSSYDSEIQRHIICQSPLSSNVPLLVAERIGKPYVEYIHELIVNNRPVSLSTDKDFKWALEIFAFALTCEESSIYQLCANIYVEWLKVFENKNNSLTTIPSVLYENVEFYWSQMFWHLYHLFVIHDEKTADLLTKRIYTHKVLRQLQILISQNELSNDLWHILLQVFLAIGDTVLSSPYRNNEESTAVMSHRLVPSIYQVFLVAVEKFEISPGLWRTFRDYAQTWRHRPAVIYDWAQLTFVLTSAVVHRCLSPTSPTLQYICTETDQGDNIQKIIHSLSMEKLILLWIRFLTILQNPAECGDVSIFRQMPKYDQFFQTNPNLKLRDFTSIHELPRIFVNGIKAIGMFVDIWLGKEIDRNSLSSPKPSMNSTGNEANQRAIGQSLRGNPSNTGTIKSTNDPRRAPLEIVQTNKSFRSTRPSVNSLMHLYGPWLFDACLLRTKETPPSRSSNANEAYRSHEVEKTFDAQAERLMDEGFAKAFATLCTIFSSVQCDEFIHPEYLSRFYYVLQQGLRLYPGDEDRSQAIIESILLHSADLFRINLKGINIVLPLFLEAIQYYLQNDLQSYMANHSTLNNKNQANLPAIRERFIRIRAQCIQILMSIISLPYHYEHLQQYLFEDYLEKSQDVQTTTPKTFHQYRQNIYPLLLRALRKEFDITNGQALFGTIRLSCSLIAHAGMPQTDGKSVKDSAAEYTSHAVILICEKGTNDPQLFLAALDTLISFVTDPMCQLPTVIWKDVLRRLCIFIDTQLHRSPKDHTREMHSTCVATYNTLVTLIIERPNLLDDQENLFQLCEIIELGVSGEKAESSDGRVCKKDKDRHPASQRVAEAAEYLMCVLFEHKTRTPLTNSRQRSITGACLHAEMTGDLLNEEAVLHLKNDICRNGLDETTFANLIHPTRFKYFTMNENTLFAINELPVTVNNGMPAIILLCRGLFGKNVWTLNFRHNSMNSSALERTQTQDSDNGKITPSASVYSIKDMKEKSFVYQGNKGEQSKSETSIPTLDSIVRRDEEKLNRFRTLKTRQINIEENASHRAQIFDENRPIPECKPPECQTHFQSIRLFLSHYGFCSLDSMLKLSKDPNWINNDLLTPNIQILDSNNPTFQEEIKKLDQISPTLFCTGQIFYLKQHQYQITDSFENMIHPEQLNPLFLTMVSQFGSVAEVKRHCGWTGHPETSWKTVSANQTPAGPTSKTLKEIDGIDSILYWVDLTTEMAFYLPRQLNFENFSNEMRIFIVWLEEFPDHLDSILPEQQMNNRDISIIGIHPLKNRLFRILLNSNAQRMQSACASIPLIDGMVLPLHSLAFFLRQAVQNLIRRKRLEDSQSSQTAYSVRKTRIRKIIEKYENRTNQLDEFFQQIFFSSTRPCPPSSTRATVVPTRPQSMIVQVQS